MIAKIFSDQAEAVVTELGGLIVHYQLTHHAIAAVIGGLFFGIEWRMTGTDCSGCDEARQYIESAGGKWIVVDSGCCDIGETIRRGVHYSTAQTAKNIDASIDLWCDHTGIEVSSDQSNTLRRFLTPGARYDH